MRAPTTRPDTGVDLGPPAAARLVGCAAAAARPCGRLLPAGVLVIVGAARLPDRAVALEAAAKAQLPDAVAALYAAGVLNVGQDVPAHQQHVNKPRSCSQPTDSCSILLLWGCRQTGTHIWHQDSRALFSDRKDAGLRRLQLWEQKADAHQVEAAEVLPKR